MAKAAGKTGRNQYNFSPTINHRYLMDNMTQGLAFKESNSRDLSAWQRRLRRKVVQLTGLDNMPKKRCALKVRSLWKREHKLGTIEKIVFTAEPYSDIPAYVCLPRNAEAPYNWFICLQGHSTGMHNSIAVDRDTNRKTIKVKGDRDFGLGCMRRGIAALCIEQRSFGERREQVQKAISTHMCHDATMHALMLGRTLMAERVYDVDRAIDYLYNRKDVNRRTLGVMGNSGGGTISLFSAALLPRIKFAMPSCYFCTFRDSIMSIYHCMDNYVPGLLQYAEMADVMGCAAPKPVVIVAGKDDPIFPIKAVRRSFKRLKQIYEAAGAGDRCHLVVGPEGHRFYADLAWPKMLKMLG